MTDFFERIEKKGRQAQSWRTSLLRTLHSTILRWSYVKNNLEKNTKLAVVNFGNFQSLLYIVVVKNVRFRRFSCFRLRDSKEKGVRSKDHKMTKERCSFYSKQARGLSRGKMWAVLWEAKINLKKRRYSRKPAPPPKQKSLNRKNGNFWLKLNLHTAQRTYWHRRETKTPGL